MNVGRALVALGRFQEAQTYFDAALDEGGEGISLRAKLLFSAQNLIQIGLFEKAIEQAHLLRAKSERKDLSYYLEGVARRRTGQPAQAAELLEQVTEMSNEAGYVFPRCMLRGQLAGALLEAGRAGEAADQLSLLVRESPEEPNIRTALKVFAVTGVSLEDLAAALPEDRLDKVATALILLPPVVADRVAEGLFIRFGPKPILLAAAIKFAPMIAIGRALEWSARLRQIGMIEPCPLIAQARTNALEVGTRIRAAVTAHAAFGDNRGANLAKALATSLHQDQLEVALSEVSVLDPPLARDFALAAAAPGAPSAGR
jgi:hypothetical protein